MYTNKARKDKRLGGSNYVRCECVKIEINLFKVFLYVRCVCGCSLVSGAAADAVLLWGFYSLLLWTQKQTFPDSSIFFSTSFCSDFSAECLKEDLNFTPILWNILHIFKKKINSNCWFIIKLVQVRCSTSGGGFVQTKIFRIYLQELQGEALGLTSPLRKWWFSRLLQLVPNHGSQNLPHLGR